MNIKNNISLFNESLQGSACRLIAVSKVQPIEKLQEAYEAGQRIFGENKVQEMEQKHEALPKDIEWHMIGHLQTNKVKYIVPFVSLIHSVDSVKLLEEINKQGKKIDRIIPCLLQIYIANEETKFGLSEEEVLDLLHNYPPAFSHVQIAGLMGMATFTENQEQIRKEFKGLKKLFEKLKEMNLPPQVEMKELSMGMSADYKIAVEEGSTLVRVGTAIFGERKYH
ncbi:MAG: YggS family pyridoxal phosphate-dependent enzyme [Cyclobacteriaceae bacterium]